MTWRTSYLHSTHHQDKGFKLFFRKIFLSSQIHTSCGIAATSSDRGAAHRSDDWLIADLPNNSALSEDNLLIAD